MGAGAWYSGSGLGDANIVVARRTIQVALHESVKNRAVMGHPVMRGIMAQDAALGQLLGELGVSISLAALGQGKLAATAEGTPATPTNFSTANSATVTPARRAFSRDVGDFARALQQSLLRGEISPDAVAMLVYDAYGCWSNDLVDRMVALAASATYAIGTTGAPLTWDAVRDGVLDCQNRGVQGAGLGLISAKGAKDLSADALALAGAVQMRAATQGFVPDTRQGAYICSEWGVDWYLNSELDTSGTDTLGIVIWDGAMLLKHQRVPLPVNEARVLADLGFLTIEADRPGGGVTRAEYASYNAVGILEQARFAKIVYAT
jgi:hypothetical protein